MSAPPPKADIRLLGIPHVTDYDMNRISEHYNQIEKSFVRLSIYQRALFLCLTTERQFPVYETYSRGKPWANVKQFRSLLDSCWNWSISLGQAKSLEVPDSINFLEIVGGQHGSGHAAYPYFALDYLCEFISGEFISNKNGSREKPISARYATDIIDAYLYDEVFSGVSSENDRKILHHPLMRQEVNRQNSDLILLGKKNWNELRWNEIKSEVKGKSVLKI